MVKTNSLKSHLIAVAKDAETGEELFEITKHGEEIILRKKGGLGGRGNSWFKNSVRQTPPRYAQPGTEGEEGWNILELKVLADVGFGRFLMLENPLYYAIISV